MSIKKLLGGVAATAIGLTLAPPVLAQETTSTIRGAVTSTDGRPVSGATVVVTHVPTGTRSEEATSGAGAFDLRGLRVGGPYTVEVSAENYASERVEDVFITVGDAYRLDLQLRRQAGDTVTVTATRVVGPDIVGSGTKVGQEDIRSVVSVNRDLRDVARRDALVTQDVGGARGGGGQGGISIAGSAPRSNLITVDGMIAGDDFGLVTNGLSTLRGPVSLDAVEQFSVQAVPFDVENGDFTGGALNVVLRQGTNDFEATLFTNYLNEGLVGERIDGVAANAIVRQENYGGFIGGPIIKDKLFASASYEYYESLDVTGRGLANEGFANVLAGFGGTSTTLSRADLNLILRPNVAGQGYFGNYAVAPRFDPGDYTLTAPISDEKWTARIDWNVTDDQRLSLSYRTAESSLIIRDFPAQRGDLDSSWYAAADTEEVFSGQLNSNWTDRFSTELRASYRNYERRQQPKSGQEFGAVQICATLDVGPVGNPSVVGNNTACGTTTNSSRTIVDFGPDANRHANYLNTTNTQFNASGEYEIGRHVIKAGGQYQGIGVENLFVRESDGVFYFDSIDAFNRGEMSRFNYTNTASGNPRDAIAEFNYAINTLFVQDSWDIMPNLTVNYGLRYDYYTSEDKPAANPYFLARNGFSNQETYDGRDVLMPRLSFEYEPGDGAIQISGGAGIVSGGAPDVFLSNSYSNTGVLTASVDIRRTGATTCIENNSSMALSAAQCAALLNVDKSNPNLFFDIPSGMVSGSNFSAQSLVTQFDPRNPANSGLALATLQEVNALDKDFEIPSDFKANIDVKANFLDFDFGLGIVGIRSREGVAFRDTRARPLVIPTPTATDLAGGVVAGVQRTPDGRLRYDGLSLSDADRALRGMTGGANGSATNILSNRDIVAYNPGEESWSFVSAVSVGREFDNGLSFNLSYARQESEDFGGYAQFGTTASGFYGEQYVSRDPNSSTKGRSNGEITDSFKFDFGWSGTPIGDLESKLTLFGEHRSGRPLNFLMSGVAAGRSKEFGVNRNDHLLFVPNLSACTGAVLTCGDVASGVVTFATPADRDAFIGIVNRFGLPQGGIVEKGAADNPDVTQVDLQFSQEVPGFHGRGRFSFDIQNVLNLISDELGVVEEWGDSRAGGRVASVDCANNAGVAQAATSPICTTYRYSNVTTSVFNSPAQINTNESRWVIVLGFKYDF